MRDILGFKDCVWWIKDFLNIKYNLTDFSYIINTKMIRYEKIKISIKNILFTGGGGVGND